MYEMFYGLTNEPFKTTPDPKFLYLSKNHEEGLAYLQYGTERKKGLIVLTGDTGTGKTMLLKTFMQRLDTRMHTAFLVNAQVSPLDLYKHTFHELGIDIPVQATTEWDFLSIFKDFLEKCSSAGETCILIFDEAQKVSSDVLEQLRLFLNFETDEEKLIQIILVGHPELHHKLNLLESAKLKQRISLTYDLLPLDDAETKDYIEKRLAVAGAVKSVFTADAIREIYRCSNGLPRLINIICDLALLHGFREKQRVIGHNDILHVEAMLSLQGAGEPDPDSAAPARNGRSAPTLDPTQADFPDLPVRPGTTGQRGGQAGRRGAWWAVSTSIAAGLCLGLLFNGEAVQRLKGVTGGVEKFTQFLRHTYTAESSPPQEAVPPLADPERAMPLAAEMPLPSQTVLPPRPVVTLPSSGARMNREQAGDPLPSNRFRQAIATEDRMTPEAIVPEDAPRTAVSSVVQREPVAPLGQDVTTDQQRTLLPSPRSASTSASSHVTQDDDCILKLLQGKPCAPEPLKPQEGR